MAIRIKCKCGTSLKISAKLAGKKVNCPNCAKPFRIPLEKFKAAAAAAKRKAAQQATEARQAAPLEPMPAELDIHPTDLDIHPAQLDVHPANLDLDPANLDLDIQPANPNIPAAIEYEQSDVLNDFAVDASQAEAIPLPPAVIPAAIPGPSMVTGYASGPGRGAAIEGDDGDGRKRGFWTDILLAFVYPALSGKNLGNLGGIVFMSLLLIPAIIFTCLMPCYTMLPGLFCVVLVQGYIWGAYLGILQHTSAGLKEMPGITFGNGVYDDAIKPFFKFIGAAIIAFGPTLLLLIALACGWIPSSLDWMVFVWLALGIFVFPLFLLIVAIGSTDSLVRIDQICVTIFRTFLPYLAMWLMLFVVYLIKLAPVAGTFLAQAGIQIPLPEMPDLGWKGFLVMQVIDVYLALVAMRIIGVYYLYFQRRFAVIVQ